jgi:hypothetical protein
MRRYVILLFLVITACSYPRFEGLHKIPWNINFIELHDTIYATKVLKINSKRCDSIIYASVIFLQTIDKDTILVLDVCFQDSTINIGDFVNVIPYQVVPKVDCIFRGSVDFPYSVFDKRRSICCYGKLWKIK